MKNIIIIILLLVVFVLGYIQLKPKLASPVLLETSVIPSEKKTITTNNNIGTNNQSYRLAEEKNNIVTKKDWGISFSKTIGWSIISDSNNKLILVSPAEQAVKGEGDIITIDYVSGSSITDNDAKFGEITYFYDESKKNWMETDNGEGEGKYPNLTPVKAVAEFYTISGLPVFRGTGRWATYIVPLSYSTFLKLIIGGGGSSIPLIDLVKTVKQL